MSIRELLKPQHPPTRSAALLCATNNRAAAAALAILALLPACSPYPDDGEFFAGVVFARNFLAGVRRLTTAVQPPASNPAPPRAQSDERINAYSLLADTGTTSVTTTPTTAAPATSPLWANLYGPKVTRPDGTSVPLHTDTAQQVYVFDGNCQAPDDYKFDERVDLYRRDRQYPIFTDLPELLSSNGGRPGRLSAGSYSAIVEVIRVQIPSGFPCQSVKRWKTVTDRTAEKIPGDIQLAPSTKKEYRLLLIFDPVLTTPPLPTQLGWFDQLLVTYVDMGPVPVDEATSTFKTMPVVRFVNTATPPVALPGVAQAVIGNLDERERLAAAPYAYSPICRTVNVPVKAGEVPFFDLSKYKALIDAPAQNPRAGLTACIVCNSTSDGGYACPLAQSGAGAR